MPTVALVRVDATWHVFEDSILAFAYYDHWRRYRDCEYIGEQHVNSYEESLRMIDELEENDVPSNPS